MERKKKRKIEKDYTVLYTAYLCALCIQIQYLHIYKYSRDVNSRKFKNRIRNLKNWERNIPRTGQSRQTEKTRENGKTRKTVKFRNRKIR